MTATSEKKGRSGVARLDDLTARVRADAAASAAASEALPPAPRPRRTSVLAKRQASVQDALGAKRKHVRVRAIDPARVRIWDVHDRDYAALSAERCADLIAGYRRDGQQFPAIVRPLENDPNHDVELVCGARRHWTANHLGLDLDVEERRLTDLEAFSLMDAENRDREDISAHERARNYLKAIDLFFDGSRSRLAAHLDMDPGNLTRLLQLAELPDALVGLYADRRELAVHHGQAYAKWLKAPATRQRLLDVAATLTGNTMKGRELFATLRGAVGTPAGGRATTGQGGAQERTLGDLLWRVRTGAADRGSTCEVRFSPPTSGDTIAIARLRSQFATLLEQLGDAPPDETSSGGARPRDDATRANA